MEEECDLFLPFLDVLVEWKDVFVFITSVYRKPTFNGLYTNWNSFVPKSQNLNLIPTLAHQVLMMYSPS